MAEPGNTAALRFFAVFIPVWSTIVIIFAMGMPPAQRLLALVPLIVVGCVVGLLGYFSSLKRKSIKKTDEKIRTFLEKRRMEKRR